MSRTRAKEANRNLSMAATGLFARESGSVETPVIIFLHGAEHSGRCWQPVVNRLPQYRCLFPDLPRHGESVRQGPFGIDRAASAVAELIRDRVGNDRVHLVGHSLGAQVGAQLLATEPDLIDRTVLCGTIVNTLPGVWLTRNLLGALAGISRSFEMSHLNRDEALTAGAPSGDADNQPDGVHPMSADQLSEIVVASAGFTVPDGLERSDSPTLFLTGAAEPAFVHQSATALRRRIPNGVEGIALGMRHDWPLRYPGIFALTVKGWLSGAALPSRIMLSAPDARLTEPPQD